MLMINFPSIRIMENENNARGDLFGRLVSDLFLSLGYADIRFNIHKSGREVDIGATHRTESRYVVAECKATKHPIGGDDINKFAGALDVERRMKKQQEVTGYFISLSGFTETALEQEKEAGSRLILLNGHQVITELINGRIIAPIERVMERAGRCAAEVSKDIIVETEYELLAHQIGWVWVIYFSQNKRLKHFALIHADGEPLDSKLAELIIKDDTNLNGRLHSLSYLPPAPESAALERFIPEAKEKYFSYLLDECGGIQLEGLPADQEVSVRQLNLENIFIPLFLAASSESRPDHSIFPIVTGTRVPVGTLLEERTRLAILAPPGGGKSTLIKRLAIAYAFPDRLNRVDDHLPKRQWFPLFIRCRHLGALAKAPIREILQSIPMRAELSDELASAFALLINSLLRDGNALLLIDGLDEISDESARISFISQLRTFLAIYPTVNLILTSREVGFRVVGKTLSSHCYQYRLAEFDEGDIRRLTLAWHREVVGDRSEVRAEAEKLVEAICKSDRVRKLAKNPLLLTTLLLVKRWVGQLPNRRSILYGKAIEVLLMTWNAEAHQPIDQDEAIPQLAFLAYTMMHEGIQEISSKRLRDTLVIARKQMPEVFAYARTSVGEFIDRVESRSSILMLSGHRIDDGTIYPTYEFRHLTFQEYLAARAIVEGYYPDRKDTDTFLSLTLPYLSNPSWKEVIPLSAVLAGRRVQPLVQYLVTSIKNHERDIPHPEFILGQCVIDEIQIPPDLLRDVLHCIVQQEAPEGALTLPILKSKYGDTLFQLVKEQYLDSPANWRKTGDIFALLILEQMNWFKGQMINKRLSTQINRLLTQDDETQKLAGLLASMKLAKSLKMPNAWPIITPEAKTLFEELLDTIVSYLFSTSTLLHFASSWALGHLASIKVWLPNSRPEISPRLHELRDSSPLDECREMAAWAISNIPMFKQ